ncbi:MAG TPA: PadR family transcriptional regulator [Vicinamibacterales bacterium]|nr:PadR family transcriptional regulator [Vicinamibacterales bacterium]
MPRRAPHPPRLSPKESLILDLLIEHRTMYGLELVANSRRQLKRGTVYVTLGRMEDKGYITSRTEAAPPDEGGLPRRLYEPTALGRRVQAAWAAAAAHLTPGFAR